jgi:hypothetical protein
MIGLLCAWLAQAGEVEALAVSSFGPPRGSALAGRDGWESGYEADTWWGTAEFAASLTDDNVGDAEVRFGEGSAADNWLINGPDAGDLRLYASLRNEDDDFAGIVWSHNGRDTFYLLGVSRNSTPPPYPSLPGNSARVLLYRVEGGATEVLIDQGVEASRDLELEVIADDGVISVEVTGARTIRIEDFSPLPPGRSGFYAYDAGFDGGNGATNVYFFELEVFWLDTDDDSVIDDGDNCEGNPNPDQSDVDQDGLGDACDPVDDRPDTGDTGDIDSGDSGDPGDGQDDETISAAGCGCNALSPAWGGLFAGFAALAVLARRRR